MSIMDNSENETAETGKVKETLNHGIVANIPAEFHSVDLRSFFSQFIESKGFDCFHFRHRPEVSPGDNCDKKVTGKTTCCVVRLSKTKLDELIKKYHGQNWVDRRGKLISQRAVVKGIKVKDRTDSRDEKQFLTKQQIKQTTKDRAEFLQTDLEQLPELCPPPIMPNGNVGTPLTVFVELIRTCSFPPKLIKKLGLTFPKSLSQKKYGNVPLDYSGLEGGSLEDNTRTSRKLLSNKKDVTLFSKWEQDKQLEKWDSTFCGINKVTKQHGDNTHRNISKKSNECDTDVASHPRISDDTEVKHNYRKQMGGDDFDDEFPHQPDEGGSDEENELEEWDRHENMHNDVDNQGRTKERLFEEEIELKWEKGGSGLVFYTDAQFWQKQENADFDEETADDWDVDMSIYEEPDGGDKDARDLLQMRIEEQWRRGNIIDPNRVGGFERHTKGFGGRVMRHQGWTEGQGLGNSRLGPAEPIEVEGQKPTSKRGLGYYGEKLDRKVKRVCAERDVIIKTIYDEPDERNSDPYSTEGPHVLKYRDRIEFVPSKDSKKL